MNLSPRQLVAALGGDVTGRDSCNVPGPGHSRTDRSLSIKLNARAPGGFVVHSFAGDNAIECRDYIRGKLGLAAWLPGKNNRTPLVVTHIGPEHDRERKKLHALRIWGQSVSPVGTIVEHYLREYRRLELPTEVAGGVIRFHGSLYFDEFTRHPGMVCLMRNIETDEPCGIHRTFLDRNTGQKIDRKMYGIARGAAIKLDRMSGTVLTLGEGVETALSARAAGHSPIWALGSSGAVATFPIIKPVKELSLLEENDPTSRRDVRTCLKRYLGAGRPVNLIRSHVGSDFNDAWKAMHQ
ncbi:toprim domain-containing protein [Bradyrhizobium sp. 35]|uniref:DUF7146 domain-containing protein n=1 Tax=Bradyrhizobium sp. 35 TaxID=2782670 RepID=UPI001FFB398B|nr:toprim domain-containing protein [Bradyrhizobium sp. 35]MCK1452100.1 toprim domain-containing protein [Bradyrhizobium sp. 35]